MRIAVWYHCLIHNHRMPHTDHALCLISHQMQALRDSGLAAEAKELHIGVNGDNAQALLVSCFAHSNALMRVNGEYAESELATLRGLQEWLQPGWLVLYHHIKGVQYPDNPTWDRWRNCMEKWCVWGWRECVAKLHWEGRDTVGCHWMTDAKYKMIPSGQRYWGGNFFWATSDYLLTLPPLPEDSYEHRYEAETWIGKSKHAPIIHDFAQHFPLNCPA